MYHKLFIERPSVQLYETQLSNIQNTVFGSVIFTIGDARKMKYVAPVEAKR